MAQASFKFDFKFIFEKQDCDEMRKCELCQDPIFLNQVALSIVCKCGDKWGIPGKPEFYFCEACYDEHLDLEAKK